MRRVGILVELFCRLLRERGLLPLEEADCRNYGRAAGCHDVGKAWLPKSILTKPGRLTLEETAVVCRHPALARQLFDQAAPHQRACVSEALFTAAADCASYHHEWWNGEGYPFGLCAYDIPTVARITSICDAYDAMTSNRVYRPAHSVGFACAELERCAGTQFDPFLARIFVDAAFPLAESAARAYAAL